MCNAEKTEMKRKEQLLDAFIERGRHSEEDLSEEEIMDEVRAVRYGSNSVVKNDHTH